MNRQNLHDRHESHKISAELRNGHLAAARTELEHEAHNNRQFTIILQSINHDLKIHHQHPLTIQHDKLGNVSHLLFGKHDIFKNHSHEKEKSANDVFRLNAEQKKVSRSETATSPDEKVGKLVVPPTRALKFAASDVPPNVELGTHDRGRLALTPPGTAIDTAAERNETVTKSLPPELQNDARRLFDAIGREPNVSSELYEKQRQAVLELSKDEHRTLIDKTALLKERADLFTNDP